MKNLKKFYARNENLILIGYFVLVGGAFVFGALLGV